MGGGGGGGAEESLSDSYSESDIFGVLSCVLMGLVDVLMLLVHRLMCYCGESL